MIYLCIGISTFAFISGFILGYWFLRSKCFFGGVLVLDQDGKLFAQIEDQDTIQEGNLLTFKIISNEKQK